MSKQATKKKKKQKLEILVEQNNTECFTEITINNKRIYCLL